MPKETSPLPLGHLDQFAQAVIPEGPVTLGRPAEDLLADQAEKPCVKVYLDGFSIDLFPVTRDRYRRFVEEEGYARSELWTLEGWAWREENKITAPYRWDDFSADQALVPACGVSWYEAMAFARWCDRALPTAAQWEKAARGADGRLFPWGDEEPTDRHLNYASVVGGPTPVDSYPLGRSPYGCFDMAGNVNNWCRDLFWPAFYTYLTEAGPAARINPALDTALAQKLAIEPTMRTDRGGGFATPVGCLSVIGTTRRLGWSPASRELWQGFRTVSRAQ